MRRHKTVLVSEKLVLQRRKKRLILLYIVLGVTAVSLALLFFVFRAPFLLINTVRVEGNKIVDKEKIEQIVFPVINEYYLGFLPKSNRLIYPKDVLEKRIRLELGRIENLDLKVNSKTLVVSIVERGSYALWCKEKQTDCYFLDSAGFIFSRSPEFSLGIYRVFEGIVTQEDPLGKQFLNEELLSGIEEIISLLNGFGFDTERISVTTLRDVELVMKKGPSVKVDLTKDIAVTKKTLETLFVSDHFKKTTSNFKSLEYVDARFGSKIFFKSTHTTQGASVAMPLDL